MSLFKKSWIHIFIWLVMLVYFVAAPGMFTRAFTKNGKPQPAGDIPPESEQIVYVVDGFEPYTMDGERLYNLFGWAFITPTEGKSTDLFARELILISEEEKLSFPLASSFRHPRLPDKFTDLQLDWDRLGYSTLIADDTIKPGKYRIALVFRNPSTGDAYYWDKPVYYLVKTPNTIRLEKNK